LIKLNKKEELIIKYTKEVGQEIKGIIEELKSIKFL
jgi:hypothetical protein